MILRKTSVIIFVLLLAVFGATQAFGQRIYDNIPRPLPGNLVSWGFEATGSSEFGDRVRFAGTARSATSATVTMSSFGCQAGHWYSSDCVTAPGATFSHPITLNLYRVGPGNQPGTLLGTITRTFAIPYRPSADNIRCTGANAGKWFSASDHTCYNGKATNVTFNLKSLHLTLPNQIVFGVAYNTTHYGYTPILLAPCNASSGGCGYDSLNVGLADPATSLSVGTNPAPNDAYQYTIYSSCLNGPVIPFGLDPGCWGGLKPSIRFTATRRDGDDDDRDDNDDNNDRDNRNDR